MRSWRKFLAPMDNYKCGSSNAGGLVYEVESNLTYAGFAEFPWTVAIFKTIFEEKEMLLEHIGGGSLIHPKFVLTAAHTVHKPERYIARLGEWNMRSEAEFFSSLDVGVEERIKHPEYRDICTPNYDIALLVLKRSVVYAGHIRPICLPSPKDLFDGQRCIATGWGVDFRTNKPANIMKRIELPVVPKSQCQLAYRLADNDNSFRLHCSSMCAGGEGADTCNKDGGSPLACSRDDGSYVLAGIVSWGLECGRKEAPGVYVDVAKFATWINDTIEEYEERNQA
uniref:Peptidase S1 domain-containing protein n=1 Tax=Anopheles farauti TaxID=69004 RepID=A0A182QQT6_9DIPT